MKKIGSYKLSGCTSSHFTKLIILMAFVVTLLLASSPVFANQNGATHYIGGNEDFMAGALPPPGFYPITYAIYATSNKLMDSDGNESKTPPGGALGFKTDVYGVAFRFVHVTKMKLLGADVAWHAIIPVVQQSTKIDAMGIDKKSSGIGDIEFAPLILGWHFSKNLHLIGTVDFMAPTAPSYDPMDPSGFLYKKNYWTIAPIVAATYISDGGFELSGKFQYFFNTKNKDYKDFPSGTAGEYQVGNELLLDYLVGQHVGNWNFGLNGFIYKQLTDDEMNGVKYGKDGNKSQSISYGPAIQYNYKNMFFNAKYQWDTNVKAAPEAQKLWLKFMYAF